jgi:DNA-binding NtrC family response regulator
VHTTATPDDQATPASRQASVPTLRVLYCAGEIRDERARELSHGAIDIGRAVSGGIVLEDMHVSRLHARVEIDLRRRTVEIVNHSKRGTEIDGERVDRASLEDGQVVGLGGALLLFRWDEPGSPDDPRLGEMIGNAPAIRRIRRLARTLAPSEAVVLLLGETGTGKEVAARAIHAASGRSGQFVAVNCAAIPEALAESQIFGHVSGAFTGASAADGFFRSASGGTLFLDEIGDLPAIVQAKLLRAIETGTVAPLGAFREVAHRARIIAATHRDLVADVEAQRFRHDLYARISDFVITLPPLRERREDILPLLRHAYGDAMPPIKLALARALLLHRWPFNVRELVRIAGQLKIRASEADGALSLALVEDALERSRRLTKQPPPELEEEKSAGPPSRDALEALLRRHRGIVADVARSVGRSRRQVTRWIKQYGIDAKSYKKTM